MKKNKKTVGLPEKLEINGKTLTNPDEIAEALNIYFAEIGKYDSEIIDYDYINEKINTLQKDSFVFYETDNEEIYNIIKNLANKNSEGHDELPISILKKINTAVTPILTYLFNICINQGIYPDSLKIGKVVAIFKSGNKTLPGNNRPITILPAINKVFEKLIYNRLSNFFTKNKIINNNQFGFRQGHNTELATTKFYEDTLNHLNNGEACCAILLDLSKAFDSVDRQILLYKLSKYGIRGTPLKLLQSYLTNRFQYIKNNNIKSNLWPSKVGVPQGGVISTLLFLILINDIKNCTKMQIINFADDTLAYHNFSNTDNIQNWINKEFNNISIWMEKNHLKLNLTKTNFIIFSPKCNKFKNLSNLNLTINDNVIIPQTETCKYLGMIIDKKLNWTSHIYNLKQSLSKTVGTLYRIRHFLNKKSLSIILHSLIISKINYGLICYGRANKTNLKPIKILLNNALRCINFLHRRDKRISTIYYEQGVLQLKDLFELQLGKLCYKFNKKLLPPSFNKFFVNTSEIHRYNTRKSKKSFFRPKNKNSSGYNRLQNLGAKLWNQTSDMLKKCKSINSFNINFKKQRLKTYIDF